ncbi:GIN domain-containing protein [Lysobacter niastensis]|uniref:Adhesin domain-containing protein n=1 Tax=Lysobacter niastensis TaxID=380629 RepID=A0ABS0B6A4_9GAMM|nr:DUF2807 domain-containing protein [Lysobacter niastensis]MBF6024545.1 hypothetical protein [Lysobacter niastensis]
MHKMLPALALALPLAAPLALAWQSAAAQDHHCKHSQPRNLTLDLAGVKAVVFEIGPHDLRVDASATARPGIQGRACSSDAQQLELLSLTQERQGEKLVVRAERKQIENGFFKDTASLGQYLFGNHYAYLTLEAQIPEGMPVQLKVGSGDAVVTGAASLSADVGSGDVRASRIRGLVAAEVGSGDIELDDIGELRVVSVGSGDLEARRIAHGAQVDQIGSGDVGLQGVGGNVQVGSIGSGNLDVRDVRGTLSVRSVGSGSIDHDIVAGAVSLPGQH